jgi:hypothetical protein
MYIENTTETCSVQKFYLRKEISNEVVWVFVAVIIRHAKRLRSDLLSSLAYRTVLYVFHLIP